MTDALNPTSLPAVLARRRHAELVRATREALRETGRWP